MTAAEAAKLEARRALASGDYLTMLRAAKDAGLVIENPSRSEVAERLGALVCETR